MIVLSPLGLLASGTAWGEWDSSELLSNMHNEHLGSTLPTGMAHGMNFNALFGDYTVPGTTISFRLHFECDHRCFGLLSIR